MKKIQMAMLLTMAMLLATQAYASEADAFLDDVARTIATESRAKAISMLRTRLAKFDAKGATTADAARLNAELAALLAEDDKHEEAAAIFASLAKLPAASADILLPAVSRYANSSNEDVASRKQETLQALATSKAFAAKNPNRAALLVLLANVYTERSFCDLAESALKEALECEAPDSSEKRADILRRLAENALAMRNKPAAEKYFDNIFALPGLHYSKMRKAQLEKGMAILSPDCFKWKPESAELGRAESIFDEAISAKPHAVNIQEAFDAQRELMNAFRKIGEDDKALGIALKLAEYPKKQISKDGIPYALYIAGEIYSDRSDWHNAQRYYRKAQEAGLDHWKSLCYKLATAARRNGDIPAAIQALTDAIACCDSVEGKKEIASLKRQISNLSATIRDKVKETSAEDIFEKTSDSMLELNLDED